MTDYYKQNAQAFFSGTVNVDMTSLYQAFEPLLDQGASVLDAGCGSGRDSLYFKSKGFDVTAFDASEALAQKASELIGQTVLVERFESFPLTRQFDAIWACASLLHVPWELLNATLQHLSQCLKQDGYFYCSFKYGDNEVFRDNRNFTNLNEQRLELALQGTPLEVNKTWITQDLRPGREDELWLNVILRKV